MIRFQRENEVITSIVDINKLNSERLRNISFRNSLSICPFDVIEIPFEFSSLDFGSFNRTIDKYPFVPSNLYQREVRCGEIFNIQSSALAKRFSFTGLNKAIVGISGGLDSTLALLVIVKTFDKLKLPLKNIITITMPGFGTTDRTYMNAINLCKNLGTDLREINIVDACVQHFKDIGHAN